MLVLTRKIGESLIIDGRITVTVMEMKGNQVRLGIDAPRDIRIFREEIFSRAGNDRTRRSRKGGNR